MNQLEVSTKSLVAKATSANDEITAFANKEINCLHSRIAELEKQVEMLQSGARSNIRLLADLLEVAKQRDTLLAALTEVRDDAIAGEGLVSNQSLVLMDSAIDGVKARIPTCTYPKAKTIQTGDGSPVEYCPVCRQSDCRGCKKGSAA